MSKITAAIVSVDDSRPDRKYAGGAFLKCSAGPLCSDRHVIFLPDEGICTHRFNVKQNKSKQSDP
jgi:hypothetical protein